MRLFLFALLVCLTPAGAGAAGPDVIFHVPWDGGARAELPARLAAGRIFAPLWVSLTAGDGTLSVADDPAMAATALGRVRVMPLITNAHDGRWDADAVGGLFADPGARAGVAARLADLAARHRWAGYIFDFEGLPPQTAALYPTFVAEMREALRKRGRSVWVTALLSTDAPSQKALQDSADSLVLMAYDECWATSTSGPVAGEDWLETVLADRLHGLDAGKVVLALGAYAYDWPASGAASVRPVPEALAIARAHGVSVTRDLATANATFDYDEAGVRHTVWIADSVSYAWAAAAARAGGVKRLALWRLGLEDAGLWSTPPAPRPYLKPGDPPPKLPRCFLLPH